VNNMLTWISSNQSLAGSVIAALIAASVAVIVFALTQFTTQRREQIRFLTPKLEELYLLLNGVSSDNASLFKLIINCVEGNAAAQEQLRSIDELTLYGHGRAKDIIMLIRLYFPHLSKIHQHLFSSQRGSNNHVWALLNSEPLEIEELVQSSGQVAHFIRLMEAEIINNRDSLVGDYVFFKKFKGSTDEELSSMPPPPDGPMVSSPNKKNQADA
jgi:hypothetical protein